MPAISRCFNRFLLLIAALFTTATLAQEATIPTLSTAQQAWLGDQIFRNECNSDYSCLTSWNQGEEFPSLGIGHFIWFPANFDGPFEETFPALLTFIQNSGTALPAWLALDPGQKAPWNNRDEFQRAFDEPQLTELRTFLLGTRDLQVSFIVKRMHDSFPQLSAGFDPAAAASIQSRLYAIANADIPYGLYALIDYVHFKGSGVNPRERYRDQGWGLLQVIENMPDDSPDLQAFVNSAGDVLSRRVANAPAARNEQRWLAGWLNRLQTYLP